MKRLLGKGMMTRENLFAGAFLFLYALILLVSDPEWLVWAGPIVLGAFPVEPPQTSFASVPLEALQAACYLVLPGLLAAMVLARIRDKVRESRTAPSPGRAAEGSHRPAHGLPEHGKAA